MSEWVKYDGKGCPLERDTLVEVELRDGIKLQDKAGKLMWDSGTAGWHIYAWRVIEEPKATPLATQVGGNHYKDMKIQPMEYSMANNLNACQHTIIKYVSRYKAKNGKQDLLKAKHTIELLIQMEYGDEDV